MRLLDLFAYVARHFLVHPRAESLFFCVRRARTSDAAFGKARAFPTGNPADSRNSLTRSPAISELVAYS